MIGRRLLVDLPEEVARRAEAADLVHLVADLDPFGLGVAAGLARGDEAAVADHLPRPAVLEARGHARRGEEGARVVKVKEDLGDDREDLADGLGVVDLFVGGREARLEVDPA